MDADEFFGEADFEQAPCEFCEELFPFDLLIQHQSGCRPDIAHYTYRQNNEDDSEEENVPVQPPVKEIAKDVRQPKIIQETQLKAADFKDLVTDAKKAIEGPLKVETNKIPKSSPSKDCVKSMVVEDPSLQETGTKLMAYGSSTNKNHQIESEKPSFKVPSLLNNAEQRELDEESKLLSDDSDEGESLEEFWKRAEIKNSQRLRSITSGKTAVF